jgi:branched-chain amino acid transport system permease protein
MTSGEMLLQFILSGINMGSIYVVAGLGFMIVYNVTKIVNFTQGEFLMLGGMLSTTFYAYGFPLPVAILFAVIVTGLIGMFLYRVVIYPIRRAPVFALLLLTFGASIIIRGLALLIWGTDSRLIPPFSEDSPIHILGCFVNPQSPWIIGSTVLMAAGLYIFFEYSITGKAFKACAITPFLARLTGINTEKMGLLAFALAASLGSLAGAIMTPFTLTHSDIGLHLAIKGFIAALVGGLNRIEGVFIGGLALGVLEALGAGLTHSGYKDAIALVVFLAVLTFRRHGLLGGAEAGSV